MKGVVKPKYHLGGDHIHLKEQMKFLHGGCIII